MPLRPIYQNNTDLENENKAIPLIQEKFNCTLSPKLPMKYSAEWIAFRDNNPVAIIEFKKRNLYYKYSKTYDISLHKITITQLFAQKLNLPIILVIHLLDGVYFTTIKDEIPSIVFSRNYRDDPDDIEPLIVIPIQDFKKLADQV